MTPSLFNRLEALGFEPGSENPEAWAVRRLEALSNERSLQAERMARAYWEHLAPVDGWDEQTDETLADHVAAMQAALDEEEG